MGVVVDYPELLLMIPLVLYLLYLLTRMIGGGGGGGGVLAPTDWPLVGMLPGVILNLHRPHDYLTQLFREVGLTLEFKGPALADMDMVFTCDPANIHHIFSSNFSNYPKGPEFRKIFDILGDGIFAADFHLWELHRKTTMAQLTHAGFSAQLESAVWAKVEAGLLPVLRRFCDGGAAFDLQDVFQRLTFDNICSLVLGHDPATLSLEMPYLPCEKAFSAVGEPLLYRHVMPEFIWKLQQRLNIGRERTLGEAARAFHDFLYPRASSSSSDLLGAFERLYEEKKLGEPSGLREFLKDTSLNLIFAGRDTTSTCLTWLFWLISQNPSAEARIREEIAAEIENKAGRFLFSAQESQRLKYLHGALCESLRLFPPVALEHKAPVRPDVLPSGHQLRENSKLIVCFYSVGRMESVWGEDCLEFKPERWITRKGGIKHEASYKFPAFNAGPRTCLGKEMAFVQMKMVAAAIIYHYRVQVLEGPTPLYPRNSIILQANHGFTVRLSKILHQ